MLQVASDMARDPEAFILLELIATWLQLAAKSRHRIATERAWEENSKVLRIGGRWSRVCTLMDAIVATLMDIG